jgi:hypothetical protein
MQRISLALYASCFFGMLSSQALSDSFECRPDELGQEMALVQGASQLYQHLISLGAAEHVAKSQVSAILLSSGCTPDSILDLDEDADPVTNDSQCIAARSLNMPRGCNEFITRANGFAAPNAAYQFCLEAVRSGGNDEISMGGALPFGRGAANRDLDRAQEHLDNSKNLSGQAKDAELREMQNAMNDAVTANSGALSEIIEDDYNGVTDDQERINLLRELNNPEEGGLTEADAVEICLDSDAFAAAERTALAVSRLCTTGVPYDSDNVEASSRPAIQRCDVARATMQVSTFFEELTDPNSITGREMAANLAYAAERRAFERENAPVPHCFGDTEPIWDDSVIPHGKYQCVERDYSEYEDLLATALAETIFEGCQLEQLYSCVQQRAGAVGLESIVTDPISLTHFFGKWVEGIEERSQAQCIFLGRYDADAGSFVRDDDAC